MCRRMKPNKYESVMNIILAIVSATITGYLLNYITDNSIISSGIVACIAITVSILSTTQPASLGSIVELIFLPVVAKVV